MDDDWGQFYVVGVTVQLLRVAADLAESYGLRVYDSIHLAAAEAVQRLAGAAVAPSPPGLSDPAIRVAKPR